MNRSRVVEKPEIPEFEATEGQVSTNLSKIFEEGVTNLCRSAILTGV